MSSRRNRDHKRKLKKSGKQKYINKIIDQKSGTVIIINSSDANLKAFIYKQKKRRY